MEFEKRIALLELCQTEHSKGCLSQVISGRQGVFQKSDDAFKVDYCTTTDYCPYQHKLLPDMTIVQCLPKERYQQK